MENKRPKNPPMGRSKTDLRCKKHPKHRQSPGVCSVCLKERLSQLSTSSSSRTTTTLVASSCSSSSSLSSLSSQYSSSESSPVHHHRYYSGSEAKGSFSLLMRSSKNVLTKSRSVAFVTRNMRGEAKDGKKKGGFWSKLIRPRTKRMDDDLLHSRTVRENMTIKAY
ncbi:uncharacterized protein LOC132278532 [Cornus florida]|uniref:uncharacterized protein LOC132278532 n=1 Tax=Cornus florida TaxID=4283 RepID=UPI0028A0F39A|nr:uncharacterized protein LOC132278532 [Cornus florida]